MGDLGAISLWMALALAAYSSVASVSGKLRGSAALVESAQAAMYATVVVLFVSTLSLVVSFIARDFEIAYVARHSDLAMPDRFTWVAFYAGNEGSLLYIAMVLLCDVGDCDLACSGESARRSAVYDRRTDADSHVLPGCHGSDGQSVLRSFPSFLLTERE